MAAYKKNSARLGAHIVFADESGFQLIPNVRKTWAPKGKTPIHRHHYRREKVSAISGISVSPVRRRVGLYFCLYPHNIRQEEVRRFLRHLLAHLRGPIIIVWDNAKIHRGERIRQLLRRHPRLRLEPLPAYAPELNPDEGAWNHAKRELANGRPDDGAELAAEVLSSLASLKRSPSRLRGCIKQSELPPFL